MKTGDKHTWSQIWKVRQGVQADILPSPGSLPCGVWRMAIRSPPSLRIRVVSKHLPGMKSLDTPHRLREASTVPSAVQLLFRARPLQ